MLDYRLEAGGRPSKLAKKQARSAASSQTQTGLDSAGLPHRSERRSDFLRLYSFFATQTEIAYQ